MRRWGRRRSDKAVWIVAILAVFALYATYLQGCQKAKDNPTGPPVTFDRSVDEGTSTNTTEPAPVAEPEGEEDASNGKVLWAKWATGHAPWLAQFFNDTANPGKVAYCIYDLSKGYNAQGLPLWETTVEVPPGTNYGDRDIDIYSVIPEDWCGTVTFQGDLIRGGVCGVAPDNHGGYNFGHVKGTVKRSCECQPGEWEEVPRSRKVRRVLTDCPFVTNNGEEKCYQCFKVIETWTETNGCEERPQRSEDIERVEIECPCEEEFTDWEIVDTEVNVGECEEVARASTGGKPKPVCEQTIWTTLTWQRTNLCTQEVETDTTTTVEVAECDCEGEGSGCHISNQGGPGDTNFNLVLTKAKAHKIHTQANGFCPGDLFEVCSCEAAKAAAEQCGDPSAGGFFCKDER